MPNPNQDGLFSIFVHVRTAKTFVGDGLTIGAKQRR